MILIKLIFIVCSIVTVSVGSENNNLKNKTTNVLGNQIGSEGNTDDENVELNTLDDSIKTPAAENEKEDSSSSLEDLTQEESNTPSFITEEPKSNGTTNMFSNEIRLEGNTEAENVTLNTLDDSIEAPPAERGEDSSSRSKDITQEESNSSLEQDDVKHNELGLIQSRSLTGAYPIRNPAPKSTANNNLNPTLSNEPNPFNYNNTPKYGNRQISFPENGQSNFPPNEPNTNYYNTPKYGNRQISFPENGQSNSPPNEPNTLNYYNTPEYSNPKISFPEDEQSNFSPNDELNALIYNNGPEYANPKISFPEDGKSNFSPNDELNALIYNNGPEYANPKISFPEDEQSNFSPNDELNALIYNTAPEYSNPKISFPEDEQSNFSPYLGLDEFSDESEKNFHQNFRPVGRWRTTYGFNTPIINPDLRVYGPMQRETLTPYLRPLPYMPEKHPQYGISQRPPPRGNYGHIVQSDRVQSPYGRRIIGNSRPYQTRTGSYVRPAPEQIRPAPTVLYHPVYLPYGY